MYRNKTVSPLENSSGFLQKSGISYQTGEQYLNYQSPKIREAILSINPLVAYSVIVDSEKEQKKLLSQSEVAWLPAVVPVYIRSEIADMAEGKWNESDRFLSAFDKEYFYDASTYKEHIQKRLNETKADIENLIHQIREWESERSIVSQFTFAADYEQQLQASIASYQEELQKIQNELSALNKQKAEIRERTEELRQLKEKQQNIIRNTENSKKEFERICGMISQYEDISIQIAELDSRCRQLSQQIEKERKKEQRLSDLIAEFDDIIKQLHDKMTEYQDLLDELNDTPEAERLSEDYSAMLAEFRLYQENVSADRGNLQEQLQKIQENIRKKAKDILRFHIEPTEYESTAYSDETYRHAEDQLNKAKEASEQAAGQYSGAVECHVKAESTLKHAEDKLAELNTELLSRSEVGSDFECRIRECESALSSNDKNMRECIDRLKYLNADRRYTAKFAERFTMDITEYTPKISDTQQDTNILSDTIENCIEQLKYAESQTKSYHHRELEPFRNTHTLFAGTLDGILSVIDNHSITGDKYFTLYERTKGDFKRYRERIAQLTILLKDVEDSRKQLVTNCLHRVGRLYENLNILSKRSTIQIGNTKKTDDTN